MSVDGAFRPGIASLRGAARCARTTGGATGGTPAPAVGAPRAARPPAVPPLWPAGLPTQPGALPGVLPALAAPWRRAAPATAVRRPAAALHTLWTADPAADARAV